MIVLCKPGGTPVGTLNGIDETSVTLHQSISETWTLTFDLPRYIEIDGKLEETNYYQSVSVLMELYLECERGRFRFSIDVEPTINNDGIREMKTVTAQSIEIELQSKFLHQFKVNCGTKDSLEYLVGYYNDNDEFVNVNLNPYTGLPIDYILVKNDFAETLPNVKTRLKELQLASKTNQLDGSILAENGSELYNYLKEIYEHYPRLSGDLYSDQSTFLIYLKYNEESDVFYIGYDGSQYTADFLYNGIDRLIEYYQEYGEQLSLIDLAFENAKVGGWSVGDIPENIKYKKYNFSIDSQDILSFLKDQLTSTMKVIVDFNRYYRQVYIVDIVDHDEDFDTGVFFTFRNLLNSVDITSSSDDGIKTKFIPTGANNLGITYVNFGENSIYNIDWFIDKVDEFGDNQYVSNDLYSKYHLWKTYTYDTPVTYELDGETLNYDNRRLAYSDFSRKYNQYMMDINSIKNKLPNDGVFIDYTTWPFKDLNIAYKANMNALETLEQLFLSDYNGIRLDRETGIAVIRKPDGTTDTLDINDTMYGNDWRCYVYTIIPNIENALKIYVATDSSGNLDRNDPKQYNQETGDWIETEGGNPWYNTDAKRVTENIENDFIYDMELFGTVELTAKQKAWREAASALYKPGYVLDTSFNVVDPIPESGYQYNTPDDAGWERLAQGGAEYQNQFANKNTFFEKLNEYLDYVSPDYRDNKLTKDNTKGVIYMAQDEIDKLQTEINHMTDLQDQVQILRKDIAEEVQWENWHDVYPYTEEIASFTEEELEVLYTLVREADYNNSNILITNLDNIVTTVDVEEELYQDAMIALSEKARPQLSFEIQSDNLFALEEFKDYANCIDLLNFVRVSIGLYEDEFVKLRVVDIESNPLLSSSDLTITFSDMTYSLQGMSDFASLFSSLEGGSSSSGGSGTSSSGSSGVYGTNDAEIQITNNMLNALLQSKTYTQALSQQVINEFINNPSVRTIISQVGTFEHLTANDMTIVESLTYKEFNVDLFTPSALFSMKQLSHETTIEASGTADLVLPVDDETFKAIGISWYQTNNTNVTVSSITINDNNEVEITLTNISGSSQTVNTVVSVFLVRNNAKLLSSQ